MSEFQFSREAQWLWTAESTPPRNSFVCFRRSFEISGEVKSALLQLTADARYEVYLNGEWLGQGPIRSWPSPWPVDKYDLSGYLQHGTNTVAVLVHDFGISTFQYLKSTPGLLAQLHWTEGIGENQIVTDESWRAIPHPAFNWSTPRINVQTGWEEQFDARLDLRDKFGRDWRDIHFDDSSWSAAKSTRLAGVAPHEAFEPRPIPFLTREVVEPKQIVRSEVVKCATQSTSFNLRHVFNAEDETANYLHGRILVATHLISEQDQQIELHWPHGWHGFKWKLNGEALALEGEQLQLTESPVLRVRLNKGINTLMGRQPQTTHSWRSAINIWARTPLQISALPGTDCESTWLAIGPFTDTPPASEIPGILQREYVIAANIHAEASGVLWEEIWSRGVLRQEDLTAPFVRSLEEGQEFSPDIFALCSSERVLEDTVPCINEPHALMRDSQDWTTIHPNSAGDARLLLDFGDELIGTIEFEVDAPEGAIIDWHGFEFIQRDGRINLCETMNNTFRYVCREGVQRYRTFTRHGFRYCFVSFREYSRPIRIRFIRAIFNSYPTTQDGDFACSEPLLERIWHVGAHSVRCCSEDAYTDCPAFEQVFWTGDARNEAIVDLVANGDPRLSAHSWLLAARSLDRTPLVEATAPSGRPLILPAWTFLWMRWAYEHFMLTGDYAFARKALPYLEQNNSGIEAHLNDRDLFEITAWNMFDWAAMDTPPDGIVTHQNCLAVLALRENALLARHLEEHKLADRWDEVADRIATAVNKYLWSEEYSAYADCIRADSSLSPVVSQQTQTAAYIAGVASPPFGSPEREERCRSIIDDAPQGFVTAGSPFFMFFALEAWQRQNRFDALTNAIREYWGPQIEAGATTFWEMYHPHKPRLTRSHCHGWSAAPTFFLTQNVLGISPLKPGYEIARVTPKPEGVTWAQGRVPTPRGVIDCYWNQEPNRFSLRLELPSQTKAQIEIPRAGVIRLTEGEVNAVEVQQNTTRLTSNSRRVNLSIE